MSPELTAAISRLREKGDELARAYNYEHELEDDRAAVKADAIQRIMKRDGCAATPAEKIVETDLAYLRHREEQRSSLVARFKADAEYWAAKCEATQASLVTPDVMLLEADNRALMSDRGGLLDANRSLLIQRNEGLDIIADLKGILVKVSGANTDLVEANRELAEQLVTANDELVYLRDQLIHRQRELATGGAS